jgi:hypothetical protein
MSYTSENIFEPRINAICDRIYSLLYEFLPPEESEAEDYIYLAFVLSGKAAAILQGETAEPINNIVFETSNETLFAWCKANLAEKLGNCRRIIFKERILIYPNDYIFEILFSATALDPELHATNIYLNNILNIPEETL